MEQIKISYDKALTSRGNVFCIIQGKNVLQLPNDRRGKQLKQKYPIAFSKINTYIHTIYDDLKYIQFWENIIIYKIIE